MCIRDRHKVEQVVDVVHRQQNAAEHLLLRDHVAVSYTHLDVYKRQLTGIAEKTGASAIHPPAQMSGSQAFAPKQTITELNALNVAAAQDVYKRQRR